MATWVGHLGDFIGKLGDYVGQFQKGKYYIKLYNASPTQPNTYRQQQIRRYFSNLTKHWDSLTDAQKSLWENYASMHQKVMMGINAFCMLNLHLLGASHADLGCIYTPPPTPATPKHPQGFSVFPMSSTVNCITWTTPLTDKEYISVYFRLHSSFCNNFPSYGLCPTVGYRQSQRFIETVRSDVGCVVHTHNWPSGARLYYKARSIDKYGRQSPWTHQIKTYVP